MSVRAGATRTLGQRAAHAWRNWTWGAELTARPRDEPVDEDEDDGPDDRWSPRTWRPASQLGPGAAGRTGVPYYDDDPDHDPDAAPASYPAWLPGETFVVSGPVGPKGAGPGRGFGSRAEARAWAVERYGAVLESVYHANRWALRVPVPGDAGRRHRPDKESA